MKPIMTFLQSALRSLATILLSLGFETSLWADSPSATIYVQSNNTTFRPNEPVPFWAHSAPNPQSFNGFHLVHSITWNFGDSTSASGYGINHSYTSEGTYTVTLRVDYTYRVCDEWEDGSNVCYSTTDYRVIEETTRTIQVVAPPPLIHGFSANPATLRAGGPVTLTWNVPAGNSLSISPGVGSVSGTSTVVNPLVPTTYTLTAINAIGQSTSASTFVNAYTVAVAVSPSSATLPLGGSQSLSATVTPANQGVTWSTSANFAQGSISGGTFTGTSPGTYTVTATSLEDPTKAATITVAAPSVSVPTAPSTSVNAGQTLQFTSSVSGATNTGLTWSVSGGGTISSTGLFTATTAGTYTVTATSLADASQGASTSVTVNSVVTGVSLNPASLSLKAGEQAAFTASASGMGGNNAAVTWSASGGSITQTGVYTAPIGAGTYTITAKSVQDASKQATATVTVSPIIVNTPTPTGGAMDAGTTLVFAASVTGAMNTGVTWSVSGGGTISSTGLFSATIHGTHTVTATSMADPSKSASTTVTVNAVVSGMTLTAPKTSLEAGESVKLTATVSGLGGGSTAVTWSASAGSIVSNGDGTFTAPVPSSPTTVTVTATSVQNTSVVRSLTFTVSAPSVSVPSPPNGTVNAGSQLSFTASVTGAWNKGLTWSVSGGGTIHASSGLFSATTAGTYTVTATSQADSSKSASTPVTVKAVVSGVTVTPPTSVLNPGETLRFTASVSGLGLTHGGVTWTTSPPGHIATDGTLTAPHQSGTLTVMATSQDDPTQSGIATVRVKGWVLKWKKDIVYVGTKEIAEVDAQGVHVTLVDHLGSPRFVVNGAGVVEAEQKFLPFGESLADPAIASKFAKGFTNHEQTDPSGLIYMQARFYLPQYGRFASPDPALDQHFQDTQSWNIYSYVRNQPTMMIDPTGMWTWGGVYGKRQSNHTLPKVDQRDYLLTFSGEVWGGEAECGGVVVVVRGAGEEWDDGGCVLP